MPWVIPRLSSVLKKYFANWAGLLATCDERVWTVKVCVMQNLIYRDDEWEDAAKPLISGSQLYQNEFPHESMLDDTRGLESEPSSECTNLLGNNEGINTTKRRSTSTLSELYGNISFHVNAYSKYVHRRPKQNRYIFEQTKPNLVKSANDSTNPLYISVPRKRSFTSLLKNKGITCTEEHSGDDYNLSSENIEDRLEYGVTGIHSYGIFCCQCVRSKEVGILERFGQFHDVLLTPGFYCLAWPITNIAKRLSLRIQQLDIECETKTKDNVFIHIAVAIQYRVIAKRSYDAHYRLTDPRFQIQAYVYDVIRSNVPFMDLDKVFTQKSRIASSLKRRLHDFMFNFGYEIVHALVIDVSPTDPKVKAAMNDINASKRLKEALKFRAETEKIKQVKGAEAHCEALYLSGIGTSKKRMEISKGLNVALTNLASLSEDIEMKDAMNILLLTQYCDMISSVNSDSIILEHSPSVLHYYKSGIRAKV